MAAEMIPKLHLSLMNVSIEEARLGGFVCLSPLQRAVAIEFVVTGHTLKRIADDMRRSQKEVQAAFGDPITRAFIHDLQNEVAQHKIINAAWVESQVLRVWPMFLGEESVPLVTPKGEAYEGKKFHAPEVASIIKHFSGNADQKATGGVQVQINFGSMGVGESRPNVIIDGEAL